MKIVNPKTEEQWVKCFKERFAGKEPTISEMKQFKKNYLVNITLTSEEKKKVSKALKNWDR